MGGKRNELLAGLAKFPKSILKVLELCGRNGRQCVSEAIFESLLIGPEYPRSERENKMLIYIRIYMH